MRTTLSLEPDVAHLLEERRRKYGLNLKKVVNEALRAGLLLQDTPPPSSTFQTRSVHHGQAYYGNLDDVASVIESLDPLEKHLQ